MSTITTTPFTCCRWRFAIKDHRATQQTEGAHTSGKLVADYKPPHPLHGPGILVLYSQGRKGHAAVYETYVVTHEIRNELKHLVAVGCSRRASHPCQPRTALERIKPMHL